MHRNLSTALLATLAMAGFTSGATAGSSDSYANRVAPPPTVTTFTAAAPPVMETYTMPIMSAPAPVVAHAPKDGYYDENRYGGNAQFGYEQEHACGGAITGEKCLVILSDHMRRVRLDGPAGTILVGNPLIADVTVLGNDTIFVSARSIGSTNIIVLDKAGNEMVTYEVFVREPRTKRVVLNNAGITQNYQCAPNCERALTQSDSPAPYQARAGVISTDLGLDSRAIGLQSGPNPNADTGERAAPPQFANAPSVNGASGSALAGAVDGFGQSIGGAIGGFTGGGGSATSAAPARPTAPPLPDTMDDLN